MALQFSVAYVGDDPVSMQVERARRLESTGLVDAVWLLDQRFLRDVWIQLACCANATDRILLGPGVTDPFVRHPALTAAAAATLDEVSHGRAILGLGAGASGLSAMGYQQLKPALAIREAIQLIRRLWAADSAVTFEGEVIRFNGDWLRFPRRSAIPIYVAGRGPRVLAEGAELADAVIIGNFVRGRGLEYSLDAIQRGEPRRSADLRPLRRIIWVAFSVDVDSAAARAAVRRPVAVALLTSHSLLAQIGMSVPDELLEELGRDALRIYMDDDAARLVEMISDEVTDDLSIAGTVTECVARLRDLRSFGIDEVVIYPFAPTGKSVDDVIQLLVSRVIPEVIAA